MKANSASAIQLGAVTPEESLTACLQWACNPRGGNNFYGRVLNGCGKRTAPGLGTAAVSMDERGRYCFLWDPQWFFELAVAMQIIVTFHEAGHLALRHLERMLRIRLFIGDNDKYAQLHKVLMIAADMADNDMVIRPTMEASDTFKAFYDELIWPESRKYPKGLSMEKYFALLLKDLKEHAQKSSGAKGKPQKGGKGKGDQQQKDGDGDEGEEDDVDLSNAGDIGDEEDQPEWFKDMVRKLRYAEEMEKIFSQMSEAEIERAMNRARKEAQKMLRTAVEQTEKSRGTIPGNLKKLIDELLEEPTIPWTQVLMGLVKSDIALKLDESTTQPNSAYLHLAEQGIAPYPGYQHNFTFRIVIAVDTSGSVSDDEFIEFMSEIKGLVKSEEGVTARLLMFDSAIQNERMVDADEVTDRYYASTRYGYGGTSFTPPLRYVCGKATDEDWEPSAERVNSFQSGPPDLVLMFTDGCAPVESPEGPIPEYIPPCPLIWVLTPSGQEHPLMQPRVLKIDR